MPSGMRGGEGVRSSSSDEAEMTWVREGRFAPKWRVCPELLEFERMEGIVREVEVSLW